MQISRAQVERVIREVLRELEAEAAEQASRPEQTAAAPAAEAREEPGRVTPARLGIGRAGARYRTAPYLDFLEAHAAARDAVLGEVPEATLGVSGMLTVASRADTKEAFLTNPELGRHLSEEGRAVVQQQGTQRAKLQVIAIDGLSSSGMVANLPGLMQGLQELAQRRGYTFGKPIFVRHGRLGVTNEIGELLGPEAAISLVGERPGLVTAESVGAYVTWRPAAETTEADRNLVSNIYAGGTPVARALEHVANLLERVYAQGVSGVRLR